jgi:hypothetical protein
MSEQSIEPAAARPNTERTDTDSTQIILPLTRATAQREMETMLAPFPDFARAAFQVPPWLEAEEYEYFLALVRLVITAVDVSIPLGICFIKQFVEAQFEIDRLTRVMETLLRQTREATIRPLIENDLRRQGRSEAKIAENAPMLTRVYLRRTATSAPLQEQFGLPDHDSLAASAYQARMAELLNLERLRKFSEARRDRAFKNLYQLRKLEAERLRQATRIMKINRSSQTSNDD